LADNFENTFSNGLLEGYQTFDAIGGVVVGGVIVISLGLNGGNFEERKSTIAKAGLLAGIGLLLVYGGLIALGASQSNTLEVTSRTDLLIQLSSKTLGNIGTLFLSVLVSLACFTTAVGIVTGTADFFKGIFNNSQKVYTITAVLGCIAGVGMGQMDVHSIIVIAIPALMFIYPITIVLIVLNVLPERYASSLVFKAVVAVTILFSVPDFLSSIGFKDAMLSIQEFLPLGTVSLAWLLPALVTLGITNLVKGDAKA